MLSIIEKKCIKCNLLKEITEFPVAKQNKDGYNGKCRSCLKQFNLEYRQKNSEKLREQRKIYNKENKERFSERNKSLRNKNKEEKKEYNKAYRRINKDKIAKRVKEYKTINKDYIKTRQRKYYLQNRDKLINNAKEYYKNNKEKLRDCKKEYRLKNKDRINQYNRNYRNNNINAKIAALTRTRIRETLKLNNAKKSNSSVKLLGCSISFLREYLESKFTKGMTWENHGFKGWHIDHIRPCSSFDLTDPEQQKICFHYTNLQPLWATKEIAILYGETPEYVGNLEKGTVLN